MIANRTLVGPRWAAFEPIAICDRLYFGKRQDRVLLPEGRPVQTRQVELAQAGDEVAFTGLVDLHGGRCYSIAYRILRDAERAEDVVQQAFLLAWREIPRLRDPERFEVWLHRLLVNTCYTEIRRNRRWTMNVHALPLEEVPARDEMISVEHRIALERAFATLSFEHRVVAVLHHHAGIPLTVIAETTGVPLGTVKSRLHYATRILRGSLMRDGLEPRKVRSA